MKVGRFTIKDRINLHDMGECDRLLTAAKQTDIESEAVVSLKKIVRILCTKWSSMLVFKHDLRRVDKILLAAGFSGDPSDAKPDPDWLLNLTSWLGARINKLPYEIATGATANEAARLAKEIARKVCDDAIRLWRIHHDPEDVLHELTDDLKKLANSEAEEIRLTAPKGPTMAELMKQAYRA